MLHLNLGSTALARTPHLASLGRLCMVNYGRGRLQCNLVILIVVGHAFPLVTQCRLSQEASVQEHRDVEECVASNTDCEVGHVATEGQTLACESSQRFCILLSSLSL